MNTDRLKTILVFEEAVDDLIKYNSEEPQTSMLAKTAKWIRTLPVNTEDEIFYKLSFYPLLISNLSSGKHPWVKGMKVPEGIPGRNAQMITNGYADDKKRRRAWL